MQIGMFGSELQSGENGYVTIKDSGSILRNLLADISTYIQTFRLIKQKVKKE